MEKQEEVKENVLYSTCRIDTTKGREYVRHDVSEIDAMMNDDNSFIIVNVLTQMPPRRKITKVLNVWKKRISKDKIISWA